MKECAVQGLVPQVPACRSRTVAVLCVAPNRDGTGAAPCKNLTAVVYLNFTGRQEPTGLPTCKL